MIRIYTNVWTFRFKANENGPVFRHLPRFPHAHVQFRCRKVLLPWWISINTSNRLTVRMFSSIIYSMCFWTNIQMGGRYQTYHLPAMWSIIINWLTEKDTRSISSPAYFFCFKSTTCAVSLLRGIRWDHAIRLPFRHWLQVTNETHSYLSCSMEWFYRNT